MRNGRQVLLVIALLGYVLIARMPGCHKYGEVSLGTYEHAQALYSICNRRDSARLPTAVASIQTASEQSEITERERAWLLEIVAQAEAGDWDTALENARRMMREQVDH